MSKNAKIFIAIAIGLVILIAIYKYFGKKKEEIVTPLDFYIDPDGRKIPNDLRKYVSFQMWIGDKVKRDTIKLYQNGTYDQWISDIKNERGLSEKEALLEIIGACQKTVAKDGSYYKWPDKTLIDYAFRPDVKLLPVKG